MEPKNLFFFVQYLMFCKKSYLEEKDRPEGMSSLNYSFDPIIVPEDTYFLIYARLDW